MIRIRKASPSDLPGVLALLVEARLPVEGVEEHFERFLVADEDGRLIATAGLEISEDRALLRSVAVASASRGAGVGIEIVRQALRFAQLARVSSVYLLTVSASEFFTRFGFRPCLRAEIDSLFPDSAETRPGGACATAASMALRDLSHVLDPHLRR